MKNRRIQRCRHVRFGGGVGGASVTIKRIRRRVAKRSRGDYRKILSENRKLIVAAPTTSLEITADVVQRLHATALLAYPEEVCGLLLGKWKSGGLVSVTQAVVVPNAALPAERSYRYAIPPRLMLEWERIGQRSGLSVVGVFHSHPDSPPAPSSTDASLAWPGYVYAIVSVSGTSAGASSAGKPWVTGMAAWTFEESAASFVEVPVTVAVAADEIEYFI
jgi:proteasome lid subunit RPN8/RPN11